MSGGPATAGLSGKIAAPVQTILLRKLLERFLAIEKDQLNFSGQIPMLPDYPGEFQEQACAGAAVVGPDKLNGIEHFCVVMRAQQKRGRRRLPLRRKLGNQIYEWDLASRSVITKCLARDLPAGPTELILNVISGFFDSLGSSRAGPETNEPLNMCKRFLAGEFFPNIRRICLRP